jgi:hypothetical protein
LAIEATAVPANATSDGVGTSVLLTDVKILWEAVSNNVPPHSIEASNVPLAEADQLLPAGRYVLLLGSGHAGHWYPAMGRQGMFAFVDAQGNELTQFCTAYSATPQAPTKAPGSISRTKLVSLLKKAPLPDAMYSPAT